MKTQVNTVKRVNKWLTITVIQQHYGNGWEDNSEYMLSDRELFIHDLREYRLTGYSTRVITRKVLNK